MKHRNTGSGKRIGLKVLAAFLVLALCACTVFFWYYPHYDAHALTVSIESREPGDICMMSYNLRCLTPLDLGERSWFRRADLIVDDIIAQAPGIIGFQEATQWQYHYMTQCLAGYDSVITYRDNSFLSEGCPIFFDTTLYTLVDKGSFWLSETPDVMSKDWGSECYRICSYVILTENHSGSSFVVFNTHLDHVSDEARINGIQVVLDKIAQFGSLPAVIMGDFNAQEGSETYSRVTEHFLDARYQTENASGTYTYQNWGNLENSKRLDYFMISREGFRVNSYGVLPALHGDVYSSDHCPIVMTVSLT